MDNDYIPTSPALKRTPLANEVANKIVEYIVDQKLVPGSRLPNEFELAEQFHVGRGTIREAIKFLVSRKVVEILPAKGTFVCETPGIVEDPLGLSFFANKTAMIHDLLDIRIILECYNVKNSALKADEKQIQRLREIAQAIQECLTDYDRCVAYDIEFHKVLSESSGNSVMPLLLPVINSHIQNFNSLKFIRQWDIANRGHLAIVEAIEKHNPELAVEEMINHLAYVSKKMRDLNEF